MAAMAVRRSAAPVRVRVPATSANLGPGFDALGLALDLHDEVESRRSTDGGLTIEVAGEGADELPRDESHLVVRADAGRVRPSSAGRRPGCASRARNRSRTAAGSGSSAAAIVAGVLPARALVPGRRPALDDDARAARWPPSSRGTRTTSRPACSAALTLAWTTGDGARAAAARRRSPTVRRSLFVPRRASSTDVARGLLPDAVPHADAALQRRPGRAAGARADAATRRCCSRRPRTGCTSATARRRCRESLALVDRLRARGPAAVVSGAGPTVLVLARTTTAGGRSRRRGSRLRGWTRARRWRSIRPGRAVLPRPAGIVSITGTRRNRPVLSCRRELRLGSRRQPPTRASLARAPKQTISVRR